MLKSGAHSSTDVKTNTQLQTIPSTLKPTRTAIVQGGYKRIHSTYSDFRECVEDYDLKSDDLVVRKWRHKTTLGAWSPWEYEVGESNRTVVGTKGSALAESGAGSSQLLAMGDALMAESASNPYLVRKDTRTQFVWRIRNLPWPKDVYQVHVDTTLRKMVVRTTNKKYFARIPIPDMDRAGIPLQQSSLTTDWGSNTLVIIYNKPAAILELEQKDRLERRELTGVAPASKEDVQCNPS
ncbi:hypothetical protein BATDEDRAFT_24217 [Batrachochytrium dendrobatidis JAM81]|uniref:Protein DPCD n=2 Tax=Batrachochytrium dendrobatidis TaxID=109871 RepID=F4P0S8_BATDJ|nr:uncharacterized protein BATDEDRAFT_24217 [Batrachochytrium dendrobatidis JAM81]EGF81646.1 hypothetical protein BATDEDRAFT_24217 [Batrachochytrium dendrobatidis JAM81]OAJ38020.1 hypothetical protein BDEG_21989 [Batrachochytrium dendrobatidis JEL423]|eukprot:XP_006677937.1 hypothetical protein BATDEDRAFT_24217 [Batrachochytrium dendrobatidis JAM81]